MTSSAARLVPVPEERLSYASMDLVSSAPPITRVHSVPGSGICLIAISKVMAKHSMNRL